MPPDRLTSWAIDQVTKRGLDAILLWSFVLFTIGWLIGFFSGKYWQVKKTQRETDSLELENRKKIADLLSQLDDSRRVLLDAKDTLNLHFRDLAADVCSDINADRLKMHREEMCRHYDIKYLPALQAYLEKIPTMTYPAEARLRAVGEIIPALQTMVRFLKMANHSRIFEIVPNSTKFLLNAAAREMLLARTYGLLFRTDIRPKWNLLRVRFSTHQFVRKDI